MMSLRDRLRQRWQRWWEARLPRCDSLTLTHRNIYILPTRAGWAYGVVVLVLLLASINEQINLGYGLTFLLAGTALVGLHQTHANLHRLTLSLRPAARVHAGQAVPLQVQLQVPERRPARLGLHLRLAQTAADAELDGRATADVALDLPTATRGWHTLPNITLATRYPLGLFRAWAYWRPAARVLVWPALDTHAPPLPRDTPGDVAQGRLSALQRTGPLEGLREHRRGDPLKWVAWKKSTHTLASGSGLVTREPVSQGGPDCWLDLERSPGLEGLSREARLSRLASWLHEAEALAGEGGPNYGLLLGSHRVPAGSGGAHLHACLDALAIWPDAPGPQAPPAGGTA